MLNNILTRIVFYSSIINLILVPPGEKNMYKRNFFVDFIDLNVGMWTSNNALTPDPEKESDGLTSSPHVKYILINFIFLGMAFINDWIKNVRLG